MASTIVSRTFSKPCFSASMDPFLTHPSLPEQKNKGYSSESVGASKSQNKLNISCSTSTGLADGLSTLLIITIGFRRDCRAFCKTNLVYAMGPSVAHTSKQTPSTMDIILSTSPPKS